MYQTYLQNIYFRFSVDKDDDAQVFKLGLAFDLTIDGAETIFPILTDTSIPIPVCSNDPFVLPGDGSIEGFVKAVGQDVGQTAVDVVLKQLGLEVLYSYKLEKKVCLIFSKAINL